MVIFIVGFFIVGAIAMSKQAEIRKKQEEINKQADTHIYDIWFNANKVFYLNDYFTYGKENIYKKKILVDDEAQKLCLIDYKSAHLVVIKFEDFLNYEVYENGSTVIAGGAVGGLYSGILGAEASGNCKDLRLIIRLNKINQPHIVYDIIWDTPMNIGLNKVTKNYKECIISLQEVVSFLEVLKSRNKRNDDYAPALKNQE